jgi:hypothetical protein
MDKKIALMDAACRLVDSAAQAGIPLRMLGGLAVSLRCPSAALPALARGYEDIDLVTDRDGGRRLADFFAGQGFAPDKELNMLNGHRRQIYYHKEIGKVDIFVEEFEMCHRLPLTGRLNLHAYTLPPADLFLTKAQIVEANRKDLLDLLALLLDHPLGQEQDKLDESYAAVLCGRDWGLFTTVNLNLERIETCLQSGEIALEAAQAVMIRGRVQALREALDKQPKTLAWKIRAVIGRRQKWYLEVEEVER